MSLFFCCCLILPTSRHTSDENNYLTWRQTKKEINWIGKEANDLKRRKYRHVSHKMYYFVKIYRVLYMIDVNICHLHAIP